MASGNRDPGVCMMMKSFSALSVMMWLVATGPALCRGEEQPTTQPQGQPQASRSLADLTIPELMSLADQARQARRYTDAINLVNLVIQSGQGQTNIDALRMLGEIAWDMGDAENARKQWTLVKRVQPSDFGANWGLGRLWLRSGQPRQAMGYLELAGSVVPADKPELKPLVQIALAQAYAGSGYRRKAIETVQQALVLDPKSFEGWSVLAMLRAQAAVKLDDFNEALSDATQLVEIANADVKTYGMTLEGIQRLYKACELKRAILAACGQVFFEQNPDGTLSDRLLPGMERAASRVFSSIVDTWMWQTDLQRTMQHFQILEMAEKAVEYDGGANPETLLKLGSLQAATGRLADAVETLQRVLVLDPGNEAARQQLDALPQQQPASTADLAPE
jgi:tetratricopeptide (TPR) repeat protein